MTLKECALRLCFKSSARMGALMALAKIEKSASLFNTVSGYSADGSALPWGGRGRGFKSRYSDQIKQV